MPQGPGFDAEPPPPPTLSPQLAAGQKVFVAHCGACHSTEPDSTLVGPSLAGIAAVGATRVDGLDAQAYVFQSIMQPSDYLVEGFVDELGTGRVGAFRTLVDRVPCQTDVVELEGR